MKYFISCILLVLVSACTNHFDYSDLAVNLTNIDNKIDRKCTAVLDDAFSKYTWVQSNGLDTWNYQLGGTLNKQLTTMCNNVFTNCTIKEQSSDFNKDETNLILIPRVLYVSETSGARGWSDATTEIKIEWTIKNKNNDLLFLQEIEGDATSKIGGWDQAELRKGRLTNAINNLFNKTQDKLIATRSLLED